MPTDRGMTRALILTASYGSGHNTAARSLARAFEREGVEPVVVDHFRDLVHPLFDRATRRLYYGMIRRTPTVWGLAYALSDGMSSDAPATFGMTRVGGGRLRRLLETLAPDVVVTVHPTPAVVMSTLAQGGHHVPPHTTVVTDFVAHSQWMAPCIDRYCVAADEVRHQYVARGIPAERIVVTGVPVRPEFEETVDGSDVRATLGLSPRAPVVMAMAGSHGTFGRLPDIARALITSPHRIQGLLVTGSDTTLARTLQKLTANTAVRTFGHVEDIRRLMAAADLLVTKAGGMTLAESMAADLPVLTYGSVPGQERRNELFAARAGIALVARSRRELAHLLDLALDGPGLLGELRERMRRLKRPDASHRIVATILAEDLRPSRAARRP
jgi:processive 1,2-diacylglycerol beta-glucosyltransferase